MEYILIDLNTFKSKEKEYYVAVLYCKNNKKGFLAKSFLSSDVFDMLLDNEDNYLYTDLSPYVLLSLNEDGKYNINLKFQEEIFMEGTVSGMEAFVQAITTGLSADALWGAMAPVAPIMIIVVLVGIGRRLAQKNTNSLMTGKGVKTK